VEKVTKRFVCPEYGVLKKENGVEIQFRTVNVIKKYPSEMPTSLVHAVIRHLKHVHSLMSSRSVPNVIQLVGLNLKKKTVCLTPVGYPEVPKGLKELVRALLDILDALVPMHQLKIMHRDLRRDNILRYCSGGQNWVIIDFDDSAQLKKAGRDWIIHQAKDAQDMDPASHAPELYNLTHDEKVDIWSVGYLIETSHYINLSPEIIKVMNDCMQDNPKKRPTALVLQRRFQKILETLS
jgi:serine/threonine protein kinase